MLINTNSMSWQSLDSVSWITNTTRWSDRISDHPINYPMQQLWGAKLEIILAPHVSTAIHPVAMPTQNTHQLSSSHSHSLSLSSSSLSLYTLSHTQARKRKGRRSKGGEDWSYSSKRRPWRSPRSSHPQEVGVCRGRSPLTLTIRI